MFGRKNFDNMHAWVEERLSDYIDNQLAPTERAQLDKHLNDCDQCRASLESIKWTVSLVKQAPAVALKRSFVLPVPPQRQPAFAFALARTGAVLATLLLFTLIGVDMLTQLEGGFAARAPAAAFAPQAANQNALPTLAALATQPTPTAPIVLFAAPTTAPEQTQLSKGSTAPASSSSASLAASPLVAPTPVPPASEQAGTTNSATASARDSTTRLEIATPAPRPPLAGSALTGTATPSPTWTATATVLPTTTATSVPPTAVIVPTIIAQARGEPTRVPNSQLVTEAQPLASPLRLAEIGALFIAVFFGALVILLRRR